MRRCAAVSGFGSGSDQLKDGGRRPVPPLDLQQRLDLLGRVSVADDAARVAADDREQRDVVGHNGP